MERQKLWLCIGIACILLLTVMAAILLTAAEEPPNRGASFVSACPKSEAKQVLPTFSAGGMEGIRQW